MVKKRIAGWAMHCHHDTLFEWVWDYEGRVEIIKTEKPEKEQELRLRLFKMLPKSKMPGRGTRLWDAQEKTHTAANKALDAYRKARAAFSEVGAASNKAWNACTKALPIYDKAWDAYCEARAAYFHKYEKQLLALHKELCPNCPWDGRTIFPARKE